MHATTSTDKTPCRWRLKRPRNRRYNFIKRRKVLTQMRKHDALHNRGGMRPRTMCWHPPHHTTKTHRLWASKTSSRVNCLIGRGRTSRLTGMRPGAGRSSLRRSCNGMARTPRAGNFEVLFPIKRKSGLHRFMILSAIFVQAMFLMYRWRATQSNRWSSSAVHCKSKPSMMGMGSFGLGKSMPQPRVQTETAKADTTATAEADATATAEASTTTNADADRTTAGRRRRSETL